MKPNRLKRLMQLAERREDAAERELAERRRAAGEAERRAAEARERLGAQGDDGEPSSVDEFLHRQRVAELRARAVEETDEERRAAEVEVLRAREEWLAAARQRRTVERLSERDRAARAVVAARASQRVLDELALRRRRQGR